MPVRPKIVFLYSFITSVALSALIGISVLLFRDFGEFEIKVLLTALTVTVTSILGLACGAYLESNRGRFLPLAGILFSLISGIMWILLLWELTKGSDVFARSTTTATLLAASCSHLSLLSLARLDRRFQSSRWAVYAAVWLLTAILLYMIWLDPNTSGNFVPRMIGVLSIVIAALTVVTPVFHKLSFSDPGTNEIDAEIKKLKARIDELETKKAGLGG